MPRVTGVFLSHEEYGKLIEKCRELNLTTYEYVKNLILESLYPEKKASIILKKTDSLSPKKN